MITPADREPEVFPCPDCGEDRHRGMDCGHCLDARADDFEGVQVDPADVDFDDPETRERWRVDGDKTAGWALGKLAAARAEQARLQANADELIDTIRYQLGLDLKPVEDRAAFFESCLIEYRRSLEADNPDLPKTYKLPLGALKRRAGRVSTKVTEPDDLVSWLLNRDLWDACKIEPSVSAVKAVFPDLVDPESGELLPGIHFEVGPESYTVEVY